MSPKKITASRSETIVPVVKTKHVIARRLGTRETAEFEDELRALFDKGYRVTQKDKDAYGGVKLTLQKFEDWTWDEFVADLREAMVPSSLAARGDY